MGAPDMSGVHLPRCVSAGTLGTTVEAFYSTAATARTASAPSRSEMRQQEAKSCKHGCRRLLTEHLRQRYGLSRCGSRERPPARPKAEEFTADELRRLFALPEQDPHRVALDAKHDLERIHMEETAAPRDVLAWARARLELCLAFSALGDHREALLCAEAALVVLDYQLRVAVSPDARDIDISPAERVQVVQTASLCNLNAAVELERVSGSKEDIKILTYMLNAKELLRVLDGDGGDVGQLVRDTFEQMHAKYSKAKLEADLWSDNPAARRTAKRKQALLQMLCGGTPLTMELGELAHATNTLEQTEGSTFSRGVRKLGEEDTPEEQALKRKLKGKKRGKPSVTEKARNPFLQYEDKEQLLQKKRKYLFSNETYMQFKARELALKALVDRKLTEGQHPDDLYDTVILHSKFARYLKIKQAKEAAEEQWKHLQTGGLHKVLMKPKAVEQLDSGDGTNALLAITQSGLASAKGFQKMKERAQVARENIEFKKAASQGLDKKAQKKALGGLPPTPLRKMQVLAKQLENSVSHTSVFFGVEVPEKTPNVSPTGGSKSADSTPR